MHLTAFKNLHIPTYLHFNNKTKSRFPSRNILPYVRHWFSKMTADARTYFIWFKRQFSVLQISSKTFSRKTTNKLDKIKKTTTTTTKPNKYEFL